MRLTLSLAAAASVSVVLAACGGSSKDFAEVSGCLDENAVSAGLTFWTAESELDYVARTAGQGAVALKNDKQEVTVMVENTSGDAERSLQSLESFAKLGAAFGAVDLPAYSVDNVAVYSNKDLTSQESAMLVKCGIGP